MAVIASRHYETLTPPPITLPAAPFEHAPSHGPQHAPHHLPRSYGGLCPLPILQSRNSDLVRPFYTCLEDHPRVFKHPPLRGVAKDTFFLRHRVHEDSSCAKNGALVV